jgi:hypothetical protein
MGGSAVAVVFAVILSAEKDPENSNLPLSIGPSNQTLIHSWSFFVLVVNAEQPALSELKCQRNKPQPHEGAKPFVPQN